MIAFCTALAFSAAAAIFCFIRAGNSLRDSPLAFWLYSVAGLLGVFALVLTVSR